MLEATLLSALASTNILEQNMPRSRNHVYYPLLASTSSASSGLRFGSESKLNTVNLSITDYIGDCPGTSRTWVPARFFSTTTSPLPGSRVRLTNLSSAADSLPYTDREYDKGIASEATNVIIGSQHEGKFFVISPGENKISYSISNSGNVLESGSFVVTAYLSKYQSFRPATQKSEEVCAVYLSISECADIRVKRSMVCPNGTIISSTVEPSHQMIRTSVVNSTNVAQTLLFNGSPVMLYPGQEYGFYVDKYSTPYISFNGTSFRLTAGKKHALKVSYYGQASLY